MKYMAKVQGHFCVMHLGKYWKYLWTTYGCICTLCQLYFCYMQYAYSKGWCHQRLHLCNCVCNVEQVREAGLVRVRRTVCISQHLQLPQGNFDMSSSAPFSSACPRGQMQVHGNGSSLRTEHCSFLGKGANWSDDMPLGKAELLVDQLVPLGSSSHQLRNFCFGCGKWHFQ